MDNAFPSDGQPGAMAPGSIESRSKRQIQPQTSNADHSRPILQPIILGTITLPSAPTQTTVGAAGGASALPATPTGYLQINIGNSAFVLPYYAIS